MYQIHELNGLSHKAKYFLYVLTDMKEIQMTLEKLTEKMGMSKRTLLDTITELEESGWIEIVRGSGKRPSIYRLRKG